jgi:hypothetical protein
MTAVHLLSMETHMRDLMVVMMYFRGQPKALVFGFFQGTKCILNASSTSEFILGSFFLQGRGPAWIFVLSHRDRRLLTPRTAIRSL